MLRNRSKKSSFQNEQPVDKLSAERDELRALLKYNDKILGRMPPFHPPDKAILKVGHLKNMNKTILCFLHSLKVCPRAKVRAVASRGLPPAPFPYAKVYLRATLGRFRSLPPAPCQLPKLRFHCVETAWLVRLFQ